MIMPNSDSRYFIAKYDSAGEIKKLVPTNVFINKMAIDRSGNMLIAGNSSDPLSSYVFGKDTVRKTGGNFFSYIAKYDSSFQAIWGQAISSTYQTGITSSAIDKNGFIYVAVSFHDTLFSGNDTIVSGWGDFGSDLLLIKYNSLGQSVWFRHIHGIANLLSWVTAPAITIGENDNLYITGFFVTSVIFDKDTLICSDETDIFVAKYDSSGNLLWDKRAGGGLRSGIIPFKLGDAGQAIGTDIYGNVYVAGTFYGNARFDSISIRTIFGNDSNDIFLAKYSPQGMIKWVKAAGSPLDQDYVQGVTINSNGRVYITGTFYDTMIFDSDTLGSHGLADIYIAEYDSNGTVHATVGGGGDSLCYANGIIGFKNGGIGILGSFYGTGYFGTKSIISNGMTDIFVIKYMNLDESIVEDLPTSAISKNAGILEAYPNPFNPMVQIRFNVSSNDQVRLSMHNVSGQLIKTLFVGSDEIGPHRLNFNAHELNSGIYLIEFKQAQMIHYMKIILTK